MKDSFVPRKYSPGTPPVPFGGEAPSPVPTETPARPQSRRSRGWLLPFLAVLALVAAVTAGGIAAGRAAFPQLRWIRETIGLGDWRDDLARTSLPLAPPGTLRLGLSRERGEELTAKQVYQKVNPSVVEILAETEKGYYQGSGVILSSGGYIVTNAHLVAGVNSVRVELADGRVLDGFLRGYDGDTDLAVLQVNARDLPAAVLGDSAVMEVGDRVYAIGNPYSLELRGTMTDGIVSALDRKLWGEELPLLQHTAAINSGSSGGALVNAWGQVVGITHMKLMSEEETYEGLGFAIPSAAVKQVCDQIIAWGEYRGTPMLGIMVYTADPSDQAPQGVMVDSVDEDSDAWAKGIRRGDIITAANGRPVTTSEELFQIKEEYLEDTITLEVWSVGGTSRELTVSYSFLRG